MIPILFKIGPITIYSFGVMMALAILTANFLFTRELRRRRMDESIAGGITFICILGGVGGSKLFSILENLPEFFADPFGQLFSPAGLTFYGGFIVSTIWIYLYLRKKKLKFLPLADMIAPTVLLAYGIGRIGCQLAGDGDYGIPSKLPWAMSYPQGTAKPTSTLYEFFKQNPIEAQNWHYDSLRMITTGFDQLNQRISRFDEVVTVHPAPVYETLFCFLAFALIWSYRKKFDTHVGKLFAITLIVMGFERLMIEFIRINPLYLGLSMAQWISIAMMVAGGYMLVKYPKGIPQGDTPAPVPHHA